MGANLIKNFAKERHGSKDIGLVNASDVSSFASRLSFAGKIKRKPMQFFGRFAGDPHGFFNRNIGFNTAAIMNRGGMKQPLG